MSDITTVWDNNLARGDWKLSGPDLANGDELITSILISLFSDRTARPDDILPDPASKDRRGWWGGDIGSRLWLLEREKFGNAGAASKSVQLRAKDYAAEGLQWMIDDGLVAVFDIATAIALPSSLYMTIMAWRSKDGRTAKNYAWAWTGLVLPGPQP